jgi:hypothetical protein
MGGSAEDASVSSEAGMTEAGAMDSGSDVNLADSEPRDSGADVTVPEAGAIEAGIEAGTDAAGDGEAGTDGGDLDATVDAGPSCVSLTVLNYEVWCSVTVNGGAAFVADAATLCVPPGTEQLAAMALPDFELGPTPWHDTSGDHGDGDPGTLSGSDASTVSSTTVVVGDAATCVWVCCPFDDGVGCPTTDQCP